MNVFIRYYRPHLNTLRTDIVHLPLADEKITSWFTDKSALKVGGWGGTPSYFRHVLALL